MSFFKPTDPPPVDLTGVEADGPGQCEYVIFHGSPNPDSANFGPDEYCEGVGDHDGYCDAHYWATADD